MASYIVQRRKNPHTSRVSVDSLALFRRGLLHWNRHSVHTNATHMIVPQVMSRQYISVNACHPAKKKKKTNKEKWRCSNSSFPCNLPCNICILPLTLRWPMKTSFTITKKAWYVWSKRFLTFDCLDITCKVVDNLGRNLLKNENSEHWREFLLPRGRNQ